MSQRVYNLIILDESGSMSIIEKQTISGFNETIQTISAAQRKHEGQRHFVSLKPEIVCFSMLLIDPLSSKIIKL
jgi:hypothetical protein